MAARLFWKVDLANVESSFLATSLQPTQVVPSLILARGTAPVGVSTSTWSNL